MEDKIALYIKCIDRDEADPRTVQEAYKVSVRAAWLFQYISWKKERVAEWLEIEKKLWKLEEYYPMISDDVLVEIKTHRKAFNDLIKKKRWKRYFVSCPC